MVDIKRIWNNTVQEVTGKKKEESENGRDGRRVATEKEKLENGRDENLVETEKKKSENERDGHRVEIGRAHV